MWMYIKEQEIFILTIGRIFGTGLIYVQTAVDGFTVDMSGCPREVAWLGLGRRGGQTPPHRRASWLAAGLEPGNIKKLI